MTERIGYQIMLGVGDARKSLRMPDGKGGERAVIFVNQETVELNVGLISLVGTAVEITKVRFDDASPGFNDKYVIEED